MHATMNHHSKPLERDKHVWVLKASKSIQFNKDHAKSEPLLLHYIALWSMQNVSDVSQYEFIMYAYIQEKLDYYHPMAYMNE